VPIGRRHAVGGHRSVEGAQSGRAGALALRPCEQGDAFVAVLDEVVDEERYPSFIVERDRTLTGAFDHAVEEDRRCRGGTDGPVEDGARHPGTRNEQAVDLVREQGLQCCELPVDVQVCVHQHHAVAGLLEPALGPLERSGVERARDVRHDEPDRKGLLRSK